MSNKQMLIRTASLELYREASKHDFKGSYAILALASGIHDIAAAILDLNELLDAIAATAIGVREAGTRSDCSKTKGCR